MSYTAGQVAKRSRRKSGEAELTSTRKKLKKYKIAEVDFQQRGHTFCTRGYVMENISSRRSISITNAESQSSRELYFTFAAADFCFQNVNFCRRKIWLF